MPNLTEPTYRTYVQSDRSFPRAHVCTVTDYDDDPKDGHTIVHCTCGFNSEYRGKYRDDVDAVANNHEVYYNKHRLWEL